jgi:predicted nucleotidyltransferase component of viral defense system
MISNRQYIEQFHLLFLDSLGRKLDKRLYALKGGCNLRFYFKSMRYSEDIDFDVQVIQKGTLFKNVQNILISPQFQQILQTRGIAIRNISSPKQTEITQRWKIALRIAETAANVHTKIEFSKRNKAAFIEDSVFESIDSAITSSYHLPPILLNHYRKSAAILQKIDALANRNVTQARDIFDIYILLGDEENKKAVLCAIEQIKLKQALANIDMINYQSFLAQVVAFLQPEYQTQYTDKNVWKHIVNKVTQYLNSLLCDH